MPRGGKAMNEEEIILDWEYDYEGTGIPAPEDRVGFDWHVKVPEENVGNDWGPIMAGVVKRRSAEGGSK